MDAIVAILGAICALIALLAMYELVLMEAGKSLSSLTLKVNNPIYALYGLGVLLIGIGMAIQSQNPNYSEIEYQYRIDSVSDTNIYLQKIPYEVSGEDTMLALYDRELISVNKQDFFDMKNDLYLGPKGYYYGTEELVPSGLPQLDLRLPKDVLVSSGQDTLSIFGVRYFENEDRVDYVGKLVNGTEIHFLSTESLTQEVLMYIDDIISEMEMMYDSKPEGSGYYKPNNYARTS